MGENGELYRNWRENEKYTCQYGRGNRREKAKERASNGKKYKRRKYGTKEYFTKHIPPPLKPQFSVEITKMKMRIKHETKNY